MDSVSGLVKNSLCHAFNSLFDSKNGYVPKSRLLVFTASLGTRLKQENVEKGLPEHRSTQYLKFFDYIFYLEKEVFASFPKEISAQQVNQLRLDIDDVCWLVCKHEFYTPETSSCSEEYYFKLFRLFCTMSELVESSNSCFVVLSASEVEFIIDYIDKLLGNNIETFHRPELISHFNDCSFKEFLTLMECRYSQRYEKTAVLEAIDEIYDIMVENVIKKGNLKKLLTPVGPWWEMWFILKQHSLSWSSSKSKKEHWGEINFQESKVQVESGNGTQFSLIVDSKTIVLNAADCALKLQWIAAINVALKHCETLAPFQLLCASKRREVRKEIEKKIEEGKRLLLQKEEVLEVYEKDKMHLELVLQQETEKLKDMELREKLLIAQLEEERQATRDEETVRKLQSRILAEEWERIDTLEKQQMQKEAELSEERRKREQLEAWQAQRQAEIEQLADVVCSLEKEKEQLHGTLKKTKIMLMENCNKVPTGETTRSLKRSVSTDLSHVQSGQWSLLPTGTEDTGNY